MIAFVVCQDRKQAVNCSRKMQFGGVVYDDTVLTIRPLSAHCRVNSIELVNL